MIPLDSIMYFYDTKYACISPSLYTMIIGSVHQNPYAYFVRYKYKGFFMPNIMKMGRGVCINCETNTPTVNMIKQTSIRLAVGFAFSALFLFAFVHLAPAILRKFIFC